MLMVNGNVNGFFYSQKKSFDLFTETFKSVVDHIYHAPLKKKYVWGNDDVDIFINMRQFLAVLWTFELLLHFDQLFPNNLQNGNKLCTNHKWN